MKRTLGVLGILVASQIFAGNQFVECKPANGETTLFISGSFDDAGKMIREGMVSFYFAKRGAEYKSRASFVEGAWMKDRLNVYVRDESGLPIAGLMVDDFFQLQEKQTAKGFVYGTLIPKDLREMECQRKLPSPPRECTRC
ncbi:hypothetical protein K2X33_10340 [bacterium]|nr:hypothetical protein [bacterium]